MERDPFKEYLKESEPNKKNKTYAWKTAIGLQEVDGLKPSEYLIETAAKNIEGKITFAEAKDLIDSYYRERPVESTDEKDVEEANKISLRLHYAVQLPKTVFIVSTESGIIHEMRKRNPHKTFIPAPPNDSTSPCNECNFMRLNTMEKLYRCLRDETPEILVDETIRLRAVKPIRRMLELS